MEWYAWVALALIALLGLMVINNQTTFAMFLVAVAFVGLIVYFFMNRPKEYTKAIEKYRTELLDRVSNFDNKLGFLYLSGGKDKLRFYNKRILGKIKGWTKIEIPQKKDQSATYIVFRYHPRGTGLLADIGDFIISLPVISMFSKDSLFAVTDVQLGASNSLTSGDIILLGISTDKVSIFETLSTPDLDKDFLFGEITGEVKRITLEDVLNEMPATVLQAIKGDSMHTKMIELLHDRKQDWGIDKQ